MQKRVDEQVNMRSNINGPIGPHTAPHGAHGANEELPFGQTSTSSATSVGGGVASALSSQLTQINTLRTNQNNQRKGKVLKTSSGKNKKQNLNHQKVPVQRYFTQPEVDPMDTVQYVKATSKIKDTDGRSVFEMKDIEVPSDWSQLAIDILVSKYFRKAGVPQGEGGHEISVRQVVRRVAHTLSVEGLKMGYFDLEASRAFEAELSYLLVHQMGAFNSPVWFNLGLYHEYGIEGSGGNFAWDFDSAKMVETQNAYSRPQCSACFIQSVDDDLMSIFQLLKNEARLFKYGSGTGSNFSKIRGKQEKLSGGGYSSGLMSFLEVLDRGAGATKSGGTTRRAAKMVCLDMDHPEIKDFITWKSREEKKVAALIAGGYPSDFNGEAYKTVGGQNSNNSIRVTDEFMEAVERDSEWSTRARTSGEVIEKHRAKDLWRLIAEASWACADPGLQYDTTINEWHTCLNTDRIFASNPCSEYMFLDDTACNLASVNLVKFLKSDGSFDTEAYRKACRTFIIAQEILVDVASYPTEKIGKNSHDYRPLGLGYANLGTLLMLKGIPYDSDEGRGWAGALTAVMCGQAYAVSAEEAGILGPFPAYSGNESSMLKVIAKHRDAAYQLDERKIPLDLVQAAKGDWDLALELGTKNGFRNSQVTVLAPTGTIGLLMDCDTTGVEPDFALVKFKKLAGGGYFKIVNQSVPQALENLGYSVNETKDILTYLLGTMNLDETPHVNRAMLREKGLTEAEISKIEKSLPGTFELSSAFSRYTLGDEALLRIGIPASTLSDPSFRFLTWAGLTDEQFAEANEVICGTMTVEGAPHIKDEHLAVFDCANKCGMRGQRFIAPMGHIKMMAATQPFLSGAISKTVNLPHETTVEEIEDIHYQGWKLGLKAIALYRDGCKLSQPLSTKSDQKSKKESKEDRASGVEKELKLKQDALADSSQTVLSPGVDAIDLKNLASSQPLQDKSQSPIGSSAVQDKNEIQAPSESSLKSSKQGGHFEINSMEAKRRKLPGKRHGFTQEASIAGHKVYLRTGEYEDGSLGELFIDMHKEGAAYRSIMNCFAIAVSLGLQHGVPLEEYVEKFTFTRFDPSGLVQGHPNVKMATSIVDYIFRVLGMEYLGRTDFLQVKPDENSMSRVGHKARGFSHPSETASSSPSPSQSENQNPGIEIVKGAQFQSVKKDLAQFSVSQADFSASHLSGHLAEMMGDAPPCDGCGHTTVRNGACYKCLNCGNSMGCS